ncbi:max-like protein X [Mya arenaria]|uniref:max-like protein X n=1 Tax=Mya arenaria TaxID=6604 RepID=UPI0022E53ED6|nr:max-like protein X [Mya arenaria]
MSKNPYNNGSFDQGNMLDGDNLKYSVTMSGSPTNATQFVFGRAGSTGSIPGSSASSAHNTDDEDSDGNKTTLSYKDRRREAHTAAEQKRRDAIKRGYDELQAIVPTCQQSDAMAPSKLSKATVLQRSIDYIQYLVGQKKKQEDELDSLRKEVMALKIMKANYEHIVKTHQNQPSHGQNQVSDAVKFHVFKQVMDALFQTFNANISVANFAELSACVFSWLEEHCKPQTLREVMLGVLRKVNEQLVTH